MMSDLISRQAILKHIEKKRQDALKMDDLREKSTIMNGMLLLEEAVRNQSSVHPERKKGRWLNYSGLPLNDFCSVCAKDSPYNKHWNFCPNCGADMRGEENG